MGWMDSGRDRRERAMGFMGIIWDTVRTNASHTRIQLETWLQGLDIAAAAVADVGGKKLPVKDRVKSWHVEQYDTLDLPEYDLNQPWELQEIYDVVFCLEVFEYIYNPLQAMKNLSNILKPSGVLYVSFHFVYPHHDAQHLDYLRYTRWGVDKLLEEAKFRSWERYPRNFKRPWIMGDVYSSEKMRGNDYNLGKLHREQGYLVMARK